jgi:hypothetical protein
MTDLAAVALYYPLTVRSRRNSITTRNSPRTQRLARGEGLI